jgi:unsaturated chondroitin disaccharide hydrolase
MKKCVLICLLICSIELIVSCSSSRLNRAWHTKALDYCVAQGIKTVNSLSDTTTVPRSIANGKKQWRLVDRRDWTSGFWPGIEWYLFEYTKDDVWKKRAAETQNILAPLVDSSAIDHDIGFVMQSAYGNGYRLTHNPAYKAILLRAADTLAKLYNSKTGTILSWPRPVPGVDWPLRHNTILDNMINLELLFWASGNGGDKQLYDIAVRHAATTMKNHFRPDYSSYHVVLYDTLTGEKIRGITHQGYSDSSMWARGQAWAIYGFTMVYRETKDERFLDFALKELSAHYQSNEVNDAFLLHSTGNKPAGGEIDNSIIYADYYYIEALLRAKKLRENKNINDEL